MKTRLVPVIVAILCAAVTIHAQVPQLINYQGRLDSTNGRPFNGYPDMTFTIYSDSVGSDWLWQETWPGISVKNGMFNVFLGARTAFTPNVFAGTGPRFLGLKVGSGTEFTQRYQFASVAYAIQSATVQDNAITTSKIVDGSVTSAKIQDGAITAADIANNNLVKSINSLKDDVTLSPGTNITIKSNGNTLTIAAENVTSDPTKVPIGSIIAFYDFGGRRTFDTTYWVYCDGSIVSDANSPLNGLRLPDLSNRYLVGFGTEGGGDIDIAAWDTTAIGNPSHRINVSHTHTGPSHSHGLSAGYAEVFVDEAQRAIGFATKSSSNWTNVKTAGVSSIGANSAGLSTGVVLGGSTDAAGTGVTGPSLSATQSIQPSSIRVRYIMRKR